MKELEDWRYQRNEKCACPKMKSKIDKCRVLREVLISTSIQTAPERQSLDVYQVTYGKDNFP